jgi:hypothetical protein
LLRGDCCQRHQEVAVVRASRVTYTIPASF